MRRMIRYIARNLFVFNALNRPIVPFRVNLLYYKDVHNVGDVISLVLFDYLLKYKNIGKWSFKTKRLALVGSVLQFIGAKTIVVGSGFLDERSIDVFSRKRPKLIVRAVRGPLTRNALIKLGYDVPEIYGDPAILMPVFYRPHHAYKRYEYVIIPHYSKLDKYKGYDNVVSTKTKDWRAFIDTICSSSYVISSSLHGIILAEAYGVPAIFLNDTESGSIFKYKDYYSSTGRETFLVADSIEDALNKREKVKVPDLTSVQQRLLSEFRI